MDRLFWIIPVSSKSNLSFLTKLSRKRFDTHRKDKNNETREAETGLV